MDLEFQMPKHQPQMPSTLSPSPTFQGDSQSHHLLSDYDEQPHWFTAAPVIQVVISVTISDLSDLCLQSQKSYYYLLHQSSPMRLASK